MATSSAVKEECFRPLQFPVKIEPDFRASENAAGRAAVVDISSSSSSGSSGGDARNRRRDSADAERDVNSPFAAKRGLANDRSSPCAGSSAKRPRTESFLNVQSSEACNRNGSDESLPPDFLQPLPELYQMSFPPSPAKANSAAAPRSASQNIIAKPFRQFWKAGDYETDKTGHKSTAGGMDHIRVHPKFLHSNATSHKWALGAIAELLDNALDEAVYGATFVKIDKIENPKNHEPMLLIEDDGGGMNPDSIRQCMSLGYSTKSKIANTIGQYGNGFKTSTMRLGADVIVFSRCPGKNGRGPTQSIGMLSYTFLRETGQEDIIVPMIDFDIERFGLRKLIRSNIDDWTRNLQSIQRWSPYATEAELMENFKEMKTQGTKIIIYNLWEDDQGQLELEFDADRYDIQLRGVNRDEKHIKMADRFAHSRHYLTYQHSLRIYASILYLKLPSGFKMFLRGKEIGHHDLIDDLMFTEVWTYRPVASDVQTDMGQMKAVVTVGFVKDAQEHIDVQGFNVYHKNRLIKPFWRLWNSAASRGRGIIGVLEANFVEPAHDKQGFERTIVLARLEARLIEMQKTYWSKHCHKVGYVNISLKAKDGKDAESNKPQLAIEGMPLTPAAPLSMTPSLHTPLSVTSSTRAPSVTAPGPAFSEGYVSGVQNGPVKPALLRSQQLRAQVKVARGANEVGVPVMRQAVPTPMTSAGILPHRLNVPAGKNAVPSNLPEMAIPRSQGQLHVHPYNASRSPLPRPSLGIVSVAHQQEVVNSHSASRSPFSQPPLGMASNSQRLEVISQAVPSSRAQPNDISPAQQTTQAILNPNFASQSSSLCSTTSLGGASMQALAPRSEGCRPCVGSNGPILEQNSAVHCTMLAAEATARSPGQCAEIFRPVISSTGQDLAANLLSDSVSFEADTREQSAAPGGEVLRSPTSLTNSANFRSFTLSQPSQEVNVHPRDNHGISGGPVSPSTQNAIMSGAVLTVEDCGVSALTFCGGKGKGDELNTENTQNDQRFANSTSCFLPKTEAIIQNDVEVSVPVESRASQSALPDLSGPPHVLSSSETNVLQAQCLPFEQHTPDMSNGIEGNFMDAPQVPLEQPPPKVSRLTAKETLLGRKSLENLGRMFAKKAASFTINQGDQTSYLKGPAVEVTESDATMRSMVQCGSNLEVDTAIVISQELEAHMVNNRQLETRLVVLDIEVTALQQKLDALKMERDGLRHQLLQERLQGRLSKQELQTKVEQTWAKVRELEAKNKRLLIVQGGNTD